MNSVAPQPGSFLDDLLANMVREPRYFFVFTILLDCLSISAPMTFMALLLCLVTRDKLIAAIIGVVGLFLSIYMYIMYGVTVSLLQKWNQCFWHTWISGKMNLVLYHPQLWLSAAPLALCLGGFISLILPPRNPMRALVAKLSRGIVGSASQQLSKPALAKQLQKLTSSSHPTGSILGVESTQGKPVVLEDADANLHTLAIGTTGSGKTTGIANIIESAIMRKHPLIYVDGKGDLELAKRVERFAKSQGTPFYIFSMVGESMKYNPIAFGGYTSKKDRIIELREWSEDHYRKIAESYLQTVFKVLDRAQITVDLHTLSRYLDIDELGGLARQLNEPSLGSLVRRLTDKRDDISSLIAEIENMVESEIGHLFDCSQGDVLVLDKAVNENAVVYFCLQPLAFPAYAEALGKLIINDIKALAASKFSKPINTKLFTIFDEFSIFAGDQIINLINQGRSAGIHAVLSTQSLSDILRKGDQALLGQVLNNTNNYLIQRQNNPDDAEILANIIGTSMQFKITSQVSTDNLPSTGSVREAREFIVHPDTIKRLGRGEAIFVNKQRFGVLEIMLRNGEI